MARFVRVTLLAGIASVAFSGVASAMLADAEFKCQRRVDRAGSKFVTAKMRCASRCIANASRGAAPFSDCFYPYGGATLACITDPTSGEGAHERFSETILRSCDVATKPAADCPECYASGDCSTAGEADYRVSNLEGQLDSLIPGVFCEQPGADEAETVCQRNLARTLGKLVTSLNKCYERCYQRARRGQISATACNPWPTDIDTYTCLDEVSTKSIYSIDRRCRDVGAVPDCSDPDSYPDGASWTNLLMIWFSGNIPSTYCASPSAAFVD